MKSTLPDFPHRTILGFVLALIAALPCFYLAWVLLTVWANPMARDGGSWVRFGVGLMLLEFILLHSGVFMSAVLTIEGRLIKKLSGWLALVLLYGLMAWGFSASLDHVGILWIFAAVVAGRSVTSVVNRHAGLQATMARSAIGVACYLLVVFLTIFIPVPEWGITEDVLQQAYPDRGGGLWEEEPQRAIAGAAMYFCLMGFAELLLPGLRRGDEDTVLRQPGRAWKR